MPAMIPHHLIRTKRKTISLEITNDARLIVRAPKSAPLYFIHKFMNEKQKWIDNKLTTVRKRFIENTPKSYIEGEKFTYLGSTYALRINYGQEKPLFFDDEFNLSNQYASNAEKTFIAWYKNQAKAIIENRLKQYSSKLGLTYSKFKISYAKKRWGSCSSNNNLIFNWRLIMAPMPIIDYVIAHELAHITEKNHSSRFWKKVASIFPEFEKSKKWLKENGHKLTI